MDTNIGAGSSNISFDGVTKSIQSPGPGGWVQYKGTKGGNPAEVTSW